MATRNHVRGIRLSISIRAISPKMHDRQSIFPDEPDPIDE